MKQIDGLVTKDEIYRLISGFRTRFKISEEAAHEMAKRVAEMPTVEAEPDKGWISVKDKMPDEGKEVLIYCPEFLEEIRKVFYTEGDFYAEREDLIIRPAPNGYCTHWQPLPEPPKGE